MAKFDLVPDSPWPGKPVDPYVRLAVAMAETEPDPAAMLGSEPNVIELLLETRHPFTITTKSDRVVRDLDLLKSAAELGIA